MSGLSMDKGQVESEAVSNVVTLSGEHVPVASSETTRLRYFKGLVWCEWFSHSRLLLFFIAAWLTCVWIIPLFVHPGWILALGFVYALVAGPVFGGSDVIHGCEEFSFSLPPTRVETYLVRLAVGGMTFFAITGLDILALNIDFSQVLSRFYVRSGLMEPLPVSGSGILFGLIVAFPFALFVKSFTVSMLTHSRMFVLTSWFWGGLASLILLQMGLWYEDFVWERLTGYFSVPLLSVSSVAVIILGARAYRRKEVGPYSAPVSIPGRWWLWIAIFLVALVAALAIISSIVRKYATG